MHYIIGFAALTGLVWFAFGENAARTVVGVVLAASAGLFLLFVSVMMYVVHRDNANFAAGRDRTVCAHELYKAAGRCQ